PVEHLPLDERVRELRRGELARSRASTLAAGATTTLYALRLARRLRTLDADLVAANTLKAFCYGIAAARLTRLPLVWPVHDRIADDYLPRRAVRVLRRAAHCSAGVIANSDDPLASLGRLDVPAAVVHEPIDAVQFSRARAHDGDRPFTAMMVGRI